MQIIGFCRFSYPAIGGYQREHSTIDERRAYLYSAKRLALRFFYFETLTLPSIKAQSDQDFLFLVLIGRCMPAPAKKRLYDICGSHSNIVIVERDPVRMRKISADTINEFRDPSVDLCAQFRLDDDDALAKDFITTLRKRSIELGTVLNDDPKFAIDFQSGYGLQYANKTTTLALVTRQLWTPALAAVFRKGSDNTIMNFGHHKIWQHMPVMAFHKPTMFIRGFHPDNDSTSFKNDPTLDWHSPDANDIEVLLSRFNIDAKRLKLNS